MAAVKKRFWTLLVRRERRFLPGFGQLCPWQGDSQNERVAAQRGSSKRPQDYRIDHGLPAIAKDVEALNDA